MTRLEELIYALATVIVRYHDSQDNIEVKDKLVASTGPTLRKKKSHERAIEIIQDKKTNFALFLEGRINACTGGYQARKEFLSFLLTEISYLKEQYDRKIPFEQKELQRLQEHLTQLFIDFRQLLSIYKNTKYTVTLTNSKGSKTQDLNGLLNDRYVGGKYCNSGQLLIDEVLFVLHMTTDDSNDELKEIAANICLEQQIYLEYQNEKLKKTSEESEKEALKLELESYKQKLETQNAKTEARTLEFEQLRASQSDLEPQLQELTQKNKTQQVMLEEQSRELVKTKEELAQTKEELEQTKVQLQKIQIDSFARRFPTYSPLLGSFAGLHMLQRTGNPRFFPQQTNQQMTSTSQPLPTEEDIEDNRSKLIKE